MPLYVPNEVLAKDPVVECRRRGPEDVVIVGEEGEEDAEEEAGCWFEVG
jgi:hypothetical protein